VLKISASGEHAGSLTFIN